MPVREQKMALEFQPYIDQLPASADQLYQQACSADTTTIAMWRDIWLKNAAANKARFGNFADHGIGELYGLWKNRPVIVAGSGPSLKYNAHKLKDRGQMALVSCLHNFHYMEDLLPQNPPELYVSLDAGPVTIEEVTEGGTRPEEEYWALTKNRTLACFTSTDPKLLEKWQGKILFFRCPVPDAALDEEMDKLTEFHTYVSCGGNVLGCCLYLAKVFGGGNPIIFIGADFSFGYDTSEKTGESKFHPWDSKYDGTPGHVLRATDVFGNKVKTWPSYWSFKCFYDRTVMVVPGIWINATEGGIFGAYPDGNMRKLLQMTLDDVFQMYSVGSQEPYRLQALEPTVRNKVICY